MLMMGAYRAAGASLGGHPVAHPEGDHLKMRRGTKNNAAGNERGETLDPEDKQRGSRCLTISIDRYRSLC